MLVECIPNFSEGRDLAVLREIAERTAGGGVRVLGLSSDPDHHRSVMTVAGDGAAVVDAMVRAAEAAVRLIDLRRHSGSHPRMGAVDVIPLVPLDDTPMAYCVELAQALGGRLGSDLGLPVYLYEKAARRSGRMNLARVRRPGFEGLTQWMKEPDHYPDFGPRSPHPSAGAVAVGARAALIAFNVWLGTQDGAVAERVARAVRGSSGGLMGVKALSMETPSRPGLSLQVSMNLTDFRRTTMPMALEMVRREADRYGVRVVRTELVGMLPLEAVLEAARYYLQLPDLEADQVLERAFWAHGLGVDA